MSTTQETTTGASAPEPMPGTPWEVPADHPHVFRAMWALMQDVAWVGMDGQMRGSGGNYAYRKVDQVIAALGHHARGHGLALQSRVVTPPTYVEHVKTSRKDGEVKETVWTTCRGLVMEYRWTSLVDGSTFTTQAVGEGRDSGDKATNKAMTAAYKYALTQGTILPTFDPDPDGEHPAAEDTRPQERQQQRQNGGGQRQQQAPPPQDQGPPAEEEQRHPQDVLDAIRQADDHSTLDQISNWLGERGLTDREWDGQSFSAHLEAAHRALGPRT